MCRHLWRFLCVCFQELHPLLNKSSTADSFNVFSHLIFLQKKKTCPIVRCSCCRLDRRNVIRRFSFFFSHVPRCAITVQLLRLGKRRAFLPELSSSSLIFVLLNSFRGAINTQRFNKLLENFGGSAKSKVRRG